LCTKKEVRIVFYDLYLDLCKRKGVKPTPAAKEMGFSKSTATKWRKGATPEGTSLMTIANYFGVGIDYFMEQKNPATGNGDGRVERFSGLFKSASPEMQDAIIAMLEAAQNKR
jgi:transcriptional regulator with XRE-family HTH domain